MFKLIFNQNYKYFIKENVFKMLAILVRLQCVKATSIWGFSPI